MFNRVTFMGRICQDLELKTTPNGIGVLTFGIAVQRQYCKKGEERQTDFFNAVAWRGTAEFISKYFSKGKLILIEGEMQNRNYVDKFGIVRYISEVIISSAYFAGENKQNESHAPEAVLDDRTEAEKMFGDDYTPSDEDYPF